MQIIKGIKEKVLIERLIRGEHTAFEMLFRFYYPGLIIYSRQFLLDHEASEEVVQEFFARLWQKRGSLKPVDSLKSYVFSSVKNRSLNVLRRRKVETEYIREITDLSDRNLLYDPDLYIASELQEKIRSAVDILPERCREIFVLSRMQGLNNQEIADTLQLSKRTVETQISKALNVLRKELKDYLPFLLFLGGRL